MNPLQPPTSPSHVDEIHRAEAVVEAIEAGQRRVRGPARTLMGVDGDAAVLPSGPTAAPAGPVLALGAVLAADQLLSWTLVLATPEISRTLGIGRAPLTFLLLLKLLVVVVAALPLAAVIGDRARRVAVAKAGAVVWTLGAVAAAFATGAWGLLAAVVATGLGAAAVEASHRPLLADSFRPTARVSALSGYRAVGVLGAVLAPGLAGLLHGADLTWRAVIVAVAAIGAGAAVALWFRHDPGVGVHDTEAIRALVATDASPEPGREDAASDGAAPLGFFETVRRAGTVPTVRHALVAWALLGQMTLSLPAFLVFFLEERWGVVGPGRGWFIAAAWLPAAGALVWFGRRGQAEFRRAPHRLAQMLATAFLAFTAAAFLAGFAPAFGLVYAGWALMFSLASLIAAGLDVLLVTAVAPKMRPHVSALAGTVFAGIGGLAGVLVLNGIDRRFGLAWAIAVAGLAGLGGALALRAAATTIEADLDRVIDQTVEAEAITQLRRSGRHLPMLACRHVDFAYGQLQVLFDVNFTVDDGEMVALLGTNGAGKSTLLRVISGLGLPSRGSVHFQGVDVTYVDVERRLGLGVSQIPGGKAVFGPLTVAENLRMYGYSLGTDRRTLERGIDVTFEAFPRLAERRNQLASTLSGGEQQMLALGKAFILSPRLLLIDELSLGLAPKIVGELLEMVRRINAAGTAVVLVEQSVNIALSLVDHAYFMEKGEIRFDGAAPELLERRDLLRSVFLEGATRSAPASNGRTK